MNEKCNEAILSLVQTSNLLLREADNFFKEYNMTAAQYNALVVISDNSEQINQNELGESLVVTKSNITGIVDQLEKKSYVKRISHGDDRRIKILKITIHGKNLIKKVEKKYFDKLGEIIYGISDKNIGNLMSITDKIKRNLEEIAK